MALESINPATGETIATYEAMDEQTVDQIIDKVADSAEAWRDSDFTQRAELLNKAASILRERKREFAELMTREMGKTLSGAEAEVDKCAWACEFYAEQGEGFLSEERIDTDARSSKIVYRPLGTVLAVMPWNFPFWQVFRFAAPALMAGNAGLLKHASNVCGCALAIEEVFRDAGFPENLFRTLLIPSADVARVIENDRVQAVTLTGSTPAGSAVASTAGKALKKTVLELGGSDPYVILEDADVEAAAETCVTSRLLNAGQSCIAAKRFIAVDAVREAFTDKVVELMAASTMGDPMQAETDLGPQARKDLRDDLHKQVQDSVSQGATLAVGGEIPEGEGAYYPPTVLTDVKPGMPAWEEEMFGPVASIIAASDEEEAIRIANDTQFGLGAAVFTRDLERGERIAADRLHAGACFVNAFVKSDPRLPFGGIKQSGYGRELSHLGIREFVNTKTVYIA